MLTLKEFANFITLNSAGLAKTYARLLAESHMPYAQIPQNKRVAVGRKVLAAAAQACQQQTPAPLVDLFRDPARRWAGVSEPVQPLAEIECLGQTLTPVVTNLEAGKFLWQTLFEVRSALGQYQPASPVMAPETSSTPIGWREESLLQLLINNLPDHIYVKDTQSRFLLANNAVQRHLGVSSPDAVIGKTDFDFSPRELAEQYYAEEQALFKSGQSFVGHEQPIFDHETGTNRWVSSTKMLFKDADGSVGGLVGLNRDITELRQVQQNLVKFKLGIDRSIDAVFLTDINGIIIYANEAFEKTYGYSPKETLGQTPRILKSGLIPPETYVQFWQTLLNKQIVSGEIVNKTKDGRLVTVEGSNNPILDDNGEILGFLAIHRDITERKQIEDLLARRAVELELVAKVSANVSTILNTQELLQTVADLTKEQFGLYHAHIYVLNDAGDTLELVAGAGEIGRQMVAQGWQIPFNREQSLVARAARTREGVVVNDVRDDPGYFQNPLLPNTRAELALPLIAGEKLLGVLDVQADRANRFTNEDIGIKSVLAAQVAIGLRNAQLYEQAGIALAETQRSQQLLRTVIDATPDWIFIKDRDHCYQLVNRSYAKSRGLQPEEVIGKNDLEIGFPEETVKGDPAKGIRGFWADDTEVMNLGQTKSVDVEPAIIDDKSVFLSTVKVPLTNEQGEAWGILSYVRDVTDRETLLLESGRLARREQTIREITDKLRTSPNLDTLLRTATQELGQRLGARHVVLELGIEPKSADAAMTANPPE